MSQSNLEFSHDSSQQQDLAGVQSVFHSTRNSGTRSFGRTMHEGPPWRIYQMWEGQRVSPIRRSFCVCRVLVGETTNGNQKRAGRGIETRARPVCLWFDSKDKKTSGFIKSKKLYWLHRSWSFHHEVIITIRVTSRDFVLFSWVRCTSRGTTTATRPKRIRSCNYTTATTKTEFCTIHNADLCTDLS